MRPGHADDVYFSKSSYIAVGDPFKQVANMALMGTRSAAKDGHLKAGHDKAFSPAKLIVHQRKEMQAAYEYKEEGVDKKKNYRDEDGGVVVGPRNFVTNPMKKGKAGTTKGTMIGEKYPYMEDDYNVKKKIEK